MAIEINQISELKKSSTVSTFLLIIGLVVLLLVGGSYFYLQNLNNKLSQEKQNIVNAINQKKTAEIKDLEKSVSLWESKINDYNIIFGNHGADSNVFAFLEKITHPKVWWSDITFESQSAKAVSTLKLKGSSDTFISLQQQLLALESEGFVNKIVLNQISLAKSGNPEFNLEISFFPGILKPIEETNQQ